jgi:hypothetical protein
MRIVIEYHDNESLTVEEVVRQAQHNYGKRVTVQCMPDSTQAYDYLTFGFSQLLTHEQIGLLYDKRSNYQTDIQGLRAKVIEKAIEIIDQVIVDNESKV